VACAWSFPLAWTLTNGQDVAFLLAWLAISLTLLRAGAPFAAGLVLSLCAAKFHLFVLLPLLIVSHRLWRFAAGLAAGGSALLAISFALQGKGWPAGFWHAIRDPRIDLSPDTLPNLRGLTHGAFIPHLLLAVLVVVAVFLVCRRAPLELGLAAVLAGGLLLNPHVTSADGALLIPAALASIFHPEAKPAHFLAILLLTPLPHIFNATPALSRLAPSLILAFVLALAYSAATGLPAKNCRIAAATRSQA
jgi:hypothetical protein